MWIILVHFFLQPVNSILFFVAAPILHDLAILYKNDIVVYKINVDNEKELARTFGIQSIPTILFVPVKGKPQKAMGALPREEFVKQIDSYLLGK
jgi:thioredoxin-like negative regulator of GroEL